MTAPLTPAQRKWAIKAIPILQELAKRQRQKLFYSLFPEEDETPPKALEEFFETGVIYARQKYPKHMEFFAAGSKYRERCFLAANRIGKTVVGGYETSCHLTGEYPDWWTGRRFTRPVKWWAAGKTSQSTRDTVQTTLLGGQAYDGGRKIFDGTGLIPGQKLGQKPGQISWKTGVPDLLDTIKVRHATGGWSTLGIKTYEQGRGAYEGTRQHGIWFDEEVPEDIYGEGLIRTATTKGIIILTFTPLEGMTPTVMGFMPKEQRPGGMK